ANFGGRGGVSIAERFEQFFSLTLELIQIGVLAHDASRDGLPHNELFRGARCPLSRAEKSSLTVRAVKYQGTPSFPRTRWLPDEPSKAYHARREIFGLRILRAQLFLLNHLPMKRIGPHKTPKGLAFAVLTIPKSC